MLQVEQNYYVLIDIPADKFITTVGTNLARRIRLRVSREKLLGLIDVLVFNGLTTFSVEKEGYQAISTSPSTWAGKNTP